MQRNYRPGLSSFTLHYVTLTLHLCHDYQAFDTLRNYISTYSHVHVRLAGLGVHNPLDSQVVVILVDGANIELHMKKISAPSVVL